MAGIDTAALTQAFSDWAPNQFAILEPGEDTRHRIPDAWWPTAASPDPDERKVAAMALWNNDFLAMIPRFAQALRERLVDVRVVQHSWLPAPTLDYVLIDDEGRHAVWLGEDPATFGDTEPTFFEALPPQADTFLRSVHAGFTTWDGESCGLIAPARMQTYAAYVGWPEPLSAPPADLEPDSIHPLRMLRIGGRESYSDLLVSPDHPQGFAITYFEPDFDVTLFGHALDELMMMALEG
ncbi:hypothetical protein [Mycolicibacterium brisbanense]|uniref:Uncharacterized protein n=1 Tax=Mycolicibacterium brisbanense TaxID=146020 RepID=A0A100VZD1_9MYCO|nr:hypothetical protein [Mycolicibacterium brisbanense]MCV7158929.1 hypothetical protein [Mycolicibacterium brisbanense]GAS88783.1 putative uncharacterized protein [Mycolicibacterium brisbanense]